LKKKIPSIIKEIKQHTPRQVNYAGGEKTISFSQMQMYSECPRKWALHYKEGLYPSSFSIHMIFGTALHEVLQHYLTVIYEESGAKADEIDLEAMFQEKFSNLYRKDYEANNKQHYSSPTEMGEFFEDAIEILKFVKKKRGEYFSKRGWYLVGCEVPLVILPNKAYRNVIYKGFLDLVLYHEDTNTFYIYDIKTSTYSWSSKTKNNKIKRAQLILYKLFFAQQFNIPIDNINVEFFILKRKLIENSDYPQKRIQQYSPSSGPFIQKEATSMLNSFIESCFNNDGSYKDVYHKENPNDYCKFCPFNNKPDLCKKGKPL
jgi:hypothetical protein